LLVRLRQKLADSMDGVDVSRTRTGDLLELSESDAALLIAEGWAERIGNSGDGHRAAYNQVLEPQSAAQPKRSKGTG
jgi:hypothetical protein